MSGNARRFRANDRVDLKSASLRAIDFGRRCAKGGSQQPISPMLPRYAELPPARCRISAYAPAAFKFATQSGSPKVGAWRNLGCSQHVEKSSVVARGIALVVGITLP
jgi:hypothetical protein